MQQVCNYAADVKAWHISDNGKWNFVPTNVFSALSNNRDAEMTASNIIWSVTIQRWLQEMDTNLKVLLIWE